MSTKETVDEKSITLGGIGITILATVVMAIMGFFFTAVASYIVGLVGNSNSPVSGMTITAVLVSGGMLWLFNYSGTLSYEKSTDDDYLVDNPIRRRPIIEKARNELGYAPGIGLQDGVRRSLIWYSGNQEAEAA